MRRRQPLIHSLVQRLYITWETFNGNDLFTYASAGAYSFLLSALPMVLMVLVILIRFLHTSPQVIQELLAENTLIANSFDASSFIHSVISIKQIGLFEIVLALSVFWMARRFFMSIQQGMKIIYRKRGTKKAIKENLIIIAGEAILVILVVVMVIIISAGNALFHTMLPQNFLTPFVATLFRNLFRFVPFGIIPIFLFLVYYFTPSARPPARNSWWASLACTASFAIVQTAFSAAINVSRYNLVYGILSNVIVILLEVYLFFFLFLFFAQYQYVTQFYDSFLIAQLYLLPPYDDVRISRQIERTMFIEPLHFYGTYAIAKHKGEFIFNQGEDSDELYYVWQGTVRITLPNQIMDVGRGKMFGEFSSIVGGTRTATAIALTDVLLLKIPAKVFQETIEVDGALSRKTLQMITDYVRKSNNLPLFSEDEL